MAKLMKRVEEFAKSPKAKDVERKMLRKAEDPKGEGEDRETIQEVAQERLDIGSVCQGSGSNRT